MGGWRQKWQVRVAVCACSDARIARSDIAPSKDVAQGRKREEERGRSAMIFKKGDIVEAYQEGVGWAKGMVVHVHKTTPVKSPHTFRTCK